jgi:hypothetical protein
LRSNTSRHCASVLPTFVPVDWPCATRSGMQYWMVLSLFIPVAAGAATGERAGYARSIVKAARIFEKSLRYFS